MFQFIAPIILLIILAAVMTCLYLNGAFEFQIKAALVYVHKRLADGEKMTVNRCTGISRRVIKFKEDGKYEFSFETELTGGSAEVMILDSHRVEIARLDSDTARTTAAVNKGERYFLCWKFSHVSGELRIGWERQS